MKTISLYGGEVTLTFDPDAHCYRWVEKNMPVDGVTSILKVLDKPALVQWAANMAVGHIVEGVNDIGLEHIDDTSFEELCTEAKTAHRKLSKSAADIGSEVHRFAERALIEQRVMLPENPQSRKGAEAFMGWLHAHNIRPISVERIIFSRTWYYAGTCDFFGHVDGQLCVLDLKTSSGLYLEMPLQLAAYAIALEEETGERIENGWIIQLDKKTGKPKPYPIPLTRDVKDAFLRVREAEDAVSKLKEKVDAIRAVKAA